MSYTDYYVLSRVVVVVVRCATQFYCCHQLFSRGLSPEPVLSIYIMVVQYTNFGGRNIPAAKCLMLILI